MIARFALLAASVSADPSRSLHTGIGAYSLSNVRFGFRADEGWEVTARVRNLFDEAYFEALATQSGSTGLIVGQPGDPRTFGVTIRAQF